MVTVQKRARTRMTFWSSVPENLVLLPPKAADTGPLKVKPLNRHTALFSFMQSIINQQNARRLEGG